VIGRVDMMGMHTCHFCSNHHSNGELFVPCGDLVFIAPVMIGHYVQVHEYLPPPNSSEPSTSARHRTPDYRRRMQLAVRNGPGGTPRSPKAIAIRPATACCNRSPGVHRPARLNSSACMPPNKPLKAGGRISSRADISSLSSPPATARFADAASRPRSRMDLWRMGLVCWLLVACGSASKTTCQQAHDKLEECQPQINAAATGRGLRVPLSISDDCSSDRCFAACLAPASCGAIVTLSVGSSADPNEPPVEAPDAGTLLECFTACTKM
jgi:hypothetical protein